MFVLSCRSGTLTFTNRWVFNMKYISPILFFIMSQTLASSVAFAAGTFKPDHSVFTALLKDHVSNGIVDYKSIKEDERLNKYLDYLQKIDTASLHPEERLPFWINAYNAWTIKVVVDNYPLKSIKDLGADLVIGTIFKTTVWDKDLVTMNNGQKMSLNDIEHKIIRKYGDARVHFVMVCAAKSCPPLRSEAMVANRLGDQMDEQGRLFMADKSKNRFDLDKRRIAISKIFDWFEGDFEKDSKSVIRFIARFVPGDTAEALLRDEKRFKIDYIDYDWRLNE